ncbi:hypothetical protein NM74_08040 [Aeromonas hydrophila]|uniref:helix-turn-helix domain-containing protein n=1 Tax=Aeromonas hydrophila TaxID=644 RepID=UPI000536E459|nr:helix-turn-helix domain-containing protein [Aeromonas hydrophila]KHA57155.1 hypothetical protein NM74_08040 [Aeromonas hydrophila]
MDNFRKSLEKCFKGTAKMKKDELSQDWLPGEIREAIKAKGLSVAELAEEWAIPVSSLYNAMQPSLLHWDCKVLIAEFLGFSVEDVWPVQAALRQEKADRRARSLAEAKALTVRQVA